MTNENDDAFPVEKASFGPGDPAMAASWVHSLEMIGPENVRARLAQTDAGPGGAIPIGMVHAMTIGFAQQWLAWHDRRKSEREASFRSTQIYWTRWAAMSATVAAAAAAIAGIVTIATRIF